MIHCISRRWVRNCQQKSILSVSSNKPGSVFINGGYIVFRIVFACLGNILKSRRTIFLLLVWGTVWGLFLGYDGINRRCIAGTGMKSCGNTRWKCLRIDDTVYHGSVDDECETVNVYVSHIFHQISLAPSSSMEGISSSASSLPALETFWNPGGLLSWYWYDELCEELLPLEVFSNWWDEGDLADGSVGEDEDTANVLEVFCLESRAATFSLALRLSWLFEREPGARIRSGH